MLDYYIVFLLIILNTELIKEEMSWFAYNLVKTQNILNQFQILIHKTRVARIYLIH
jgi:hypothetical protein